MTASTHRLSVAHGASPASPDGALVRIATGDRWLTRLPPAPTGGQVTVSLSSRPAAARYADDLERQGYRVVAVPADPAWPLVEPGRGAHADFLVPTVVVEDQPRWWRGFTARADAVFNLGHGPVGLALTEVLQVHLAGRR